MKQKRGIRRTETAICSFYRRCVLLSVLMYRTERKTENTCGTSYCSYKRSVNRCIPMLRKEETVSKV